MGYTRETLPEPEDPRVRIVEVPAETLAVLGFTGSTGDATVAAKEERLGALLAVSTWRATGPAVALFYDPPWTLPFRRRNEVALPVAPRGLTLRGRPAVRRSLVLPKGLSAFGLHEAGLSPGPIGLRPTSGPGGQSTSNTWPVRPPSMLLL